MSAPPSSPPRTSARKHTLIDPAPLPLALLLAFNPAVIGQIAIFLVILAGLVVFHEFGHFVFAKRFGVTVEEFAVGFGPRIASVMRGGTAYSLNALPLGGYCKMLGEDTADDGTADPGNFQHKPLWQRIVIIVALAAATAAARRAGRQ